MPPNGYKEGLFNFSYSSNKWILSVYSTQETLPPDGNTIQIKYNPCPQRAPGGKNINTKLQVTLLHIIKEYVKSAV